MLFLIFASLFELDGNELGLPATDILTTDPDRNWIRVAYSSAAASVAKALLELVKFLLCPWPFCAANLLAFRPTTLAVPLSRAYKHWNLLATLGALWERSLPEAAAVPAARAALIVADIQEMGGVDGKRRRGCNLLGHLSDAAVPELFSRPELRRTWRRMVA